MDSVKVQVESSESSELQYVQVPPLSVEKKYSTCDIFSHQEKGMNSDEVSREDTVRTIHATDTTDGYQATDRYDDEQVTQDN